MVRTLEQIVLDAQSNVIRRLKRAGKYTLWMSLFGVPDEAVMLELAVEIERLRSEAHDI